MKKRFISAILLLAIILPLFQPICLATEEATTSTYEDFEYTIENNEVTITKYNGNNSSVVIPETIEGLSITAIGNNAFEACGSLTNISLPKNITSIGESAFAHTGLIEITIPDSVTKIEDYAFWYCQKLTDVVIPNNVTTIGDYAFGNCIRLESITIPKSVTSIGDNTFTGGFENLYVTIYAYKGSMAEAFANNNNNISIVLLDKYTVTFKDYNGTILKTETVQHGNPATAPEEPTREGYTFTSWDKKFDNITDNLEVIAQYEVNQYTVIFKDYNGTILKTETVQYGNSATAPEEPTREGYTFTSWNKSFDNITSDLEITATYTKNEEELKDFEYIIENNEVTITKYNGNSKDVIIPETIEGLPVTSIIGASHPLNSIFYSCTSVKLPNTLKAIGSYAFSMSKITDLSIPDNVINIGDGAFYYCESLTNITLPNNLQSIGSHVFNGCTSLSNITLPNSITSIGDSAFYSCTSLTDIEIPNNVTSIGDCAFYSCTNLTNMEIPNSVISIGNSTFMTCANLTDITMPDTITIIENNLFRGCKKLENIIIPDKVEYINSSAFASCDNLKKLTISKNVQRIASNAFDNSNNVVFYTYKNSVAETFAKSNSIPVVLLDEEENSSSNTHPEETTKLPNIDITPYMFNSTYYADMNTDLKNAFGYNETLLKNHYLTYGIKEGRQASPIFNATYYLNNNSDVKKTFGATGYEEAYKHFIQYGITEGRQASKYFSVTYYLSKNADVKKAFSNNYTYAIMHFANCGITEGRQASNDFNVIDYYNKCNGYVKKKLGKNYIQYYAHSQGANVIVDNPIDIAPYMFDVDLYYSLYGDLQSAFGYNEIVLKNHYLACGIKEGRIASYVFDPIYYLKNNNDLKSAFGSNGYEEAYRHFINYGINEGRQASKYFNVQYYLNNNGDLSNEYGTNYSKALAHFINYGISEGRQTSKEFDVTTYKKNYGDLSKAFGNSYKQYFRHYIIYGAKENRKCI